MSKKVNKIGDLEIYLHALGLESSFSNTKYCRIFKSFLQKEISKEELQVLLPSPNEHFWNMAKSELSEAKDLGIICIPITAEDYPPSLGEIEDPPLILFISAKKTWNTGLLSGKKLFGIVGSRKISPYGVSVTKRISRVVTEAGFTVVSGLAYGVDACAHEGSLSVSSPVTFPTVAVLGSGLLEIYPATHRKLASDIIDAGGCVVSEYGLKRGPRGYLFPRRNRIISGLGFGVLVVEAEEKSGSLITARLALEQGRDVYAVPGSIDSPYSAGCNKILSEGAMPVRSVEDLLRSLKNSFPEMHVKTKERQRSKKRVGHLRELRTDIEILEAPNTSRSIIEDQERENLKTDKESVLIRSIKEGKSSFDELMGLGIFQESELYSLLLTLQMSDIIQEVSGVYVVID